MSGNEPGRKIVAASLGLWGIALLAVLFTTLRAAPGVPTAPTATHNPGQVSGRSGAATVGLLSPTAPPLQPAAPPATPRTTVPALAATAPPLAATAPPLASAPTGSPISPVAESITVPDAICLVETAVAALRTGQLEALLAYSGGGHSTLQARFNLDPAEQITGLQLTTSYQAATGARSDEYILLRDRSWRRQGAAWVPTTEQADIRAQFLGYLPHPGAGTGMTAQLAAGNVVLRYYDPARDADTTLTVDRGTGQPYLLRQALRQSAVVVTITYTGWNTPVQILPPPATPAA